MTKLDELKPGDEVAIVDGGHYRSSVRIAHVERVTKTLIDVGARTFSRRTGIARVHSFAAMHLAPHVHPLTDDLRREALRQQVRDAITGEDASNLTLDQLRRIKAIMDEPKP